MLLRVVTTLIVLLLVKNSNSQWLSCSQVDFCERLRYQPRNNTYSFLSITTANPSSVSVTFISTSNPGSNSIYNLTLQLIADATFRVTIDHIFDPRHRVQDVLNGEPQQNILNVTDQNGSYYQITSNDATVLLYRDPLKLIFFWRDKLVAVVDTDKLVFEDNLYYREKAVALEFLFPGAEGAYGLPEHADHFSLRETVNLTNPYRLYNIDNYGYDTESTQALYGSVPVLYAHSANRTSGVFWLNSAQTFVEIERRYGDLYTYFISESGVIDFFILGGPTFKNAVQQYAKLTGVAPLPPYFTLGYHQSRNWYQNQSDVLNVTDQLIAYNFSTDVLWLDFASGNNMKYFQFDPYNFPDPIYLQDYLYNKSKRLVAAIEPFTKVDTSYPIYNEALERDYFVKASDGTNLYMNFSGAYFHFIDYFNPDARSYFASLYSFNVFNESTPILHVWNDLNEPTVFGRDDIERTMPKDTRHYGGWLHSDVHNQFGFYETAASYQGLVDRLNGTQRAFVLTRAHFAGSQRYAAIWTGDNQAEWRYLEMVGPMCLSEAVAGISFCGSDIGGFGQNPSEQLLTRWYQVAIWTSFFRQHSDSDTPRREPYLYSTFVQEIIRNAIRIRYAHLPYWYTVFYEHYRTGDPVIRPLVFDFPDDVDVLDIDDQWLVGGSILVSPVVKENATSRVVYLPGGRDELWYNTEFSLLYYGGNYSVNVDNTTNLYFYKAGTIVARRDSVKQSATDSIEDPINLYIFLNSSNAAVGTLYVDDGISFDYQRKEYIYREFSFIDEIFSFRDIDSDASYNGNVIIGSIIIYRPPSILKLMDMEGVKIEPTVETVETLIPNVMRQL